MEQSNAFTNVKAPASFAELKAVLKKFRKLTFDELDNEVIRMLLNGFPIIVKKFETDEHVDINTAVKWFRLYVANELMAASGSQPVLNVTTSLEDYISQVDRQYAQLTSSDAAIVDEFRTGYERQLSAVDAQRFFLENELIAIDQKLYPLEYLDELSKHFVQKYRRLLYTVSAVRQNFVSCISQSRSNLNSSLTNVDNNIRSLNSLYNINFKNGILDCERNAKNISQIHLEFAEANYRGCAYWDPALCESISEKLYAHSLVTNSSKSKFFAKSVPLTITYIIGCLQHGPKNSPQFYSEVLSMTLKLVQHTEPAYLKELELYGGGAIASLWSIIDYVGSFNLQLQTLELITLLLKNLSEKFKYYEINEMVNNEPDEIKYLLLDLPKQVEAMDMFKKMSRKILNLHNENRQSSTSVYSFYCKNVYLGKNFKFIKPSFADRFWFDINFTCNTLSFEGRRSLGSGKKNFNVNVSLKSPKISIGSNKLIVQFVKPAEVFDSLGDKQNGIEDVELAYFEEFTKAEIKRFEKAFKDTIIGKTLLKQKCYFDFSSRHNNANEQNLFPQIKPRIPSLLKVKEVKPFKTAWDSLVEEFNLEDKNTSKETQAEPGQSYKNFHTHQPVLYNNDKPMEDVQKAKKRIFLKMNESDSLDADASTSQAATAKNKRMKVCKKNIFDTVKNDTPPSTSNLKVASVVDRKNLATKLDFMKQPNIDKSITAIIEEQQNNMPTLYESSVIKFNSKQNSTLIQRKRKNCDINCEQSTEMHTNCNNDYVYYQQSKNTTAFQSSGLHISSGKKFRSEIGYSTFEKIIARKKITLEVCSNMEISSNDNNISGPFKD